MLRRSPSSGDGGEGMKTRTETEMEEKEMLGGWGRRRRRGRDRWRARRTRGRRRLFRVDMIILISSCDAGTFFIYSGVCAVTFLFVLKLVPETKGRTLEEIHESMSSHGRRGSNATLMLALGMTMAYLLGLVVTWRVLTLLGKDWSYKGFEIALQRFRGKDADIHDKAMEILVGIGLMALANLNGASAIQYYASDIFVSAGFSSEDLGTILLAAMQEHEGASTLVLAMILTGIMIYGAFYVVGMAGLPWVIISEIFDLKIKAIAAGFASMVTWLASWLVSYTYSYLESWSAAGTFFIYSGVCAVTFLFVIKLVPETKGRSLEEIHESMSSHGRHGSNATVE
ncbi:putative metabolite transport protein [Nymphaea thermarum]|nr:putative metabolite transport protein [Nymphaea thermarum]